MKRLFKSHPQATLMGLGFAFLAIVAVCYFWGATVLFKRLRASLQIPEVSDRLPGFDLESARALGLKIEK